MTIQDALPEPEEANRQAALLEEARLVVGSQCFRRSDQLCKLLLYLADRTNADDQAGLSEKSIGEQVFGRRNFDPRIDTIVRVQARRLRQKLEDYYTSEGAASIGRLSLSNHPYRLQLLSLKDLPVPPGPPSIWKNRGFGYGLLAGVCCASIIGLLLLALRPAAPQATVSAAVRTHPLWRGLATPGKEIVVVVSTPFFLRSLTGYIRDFRLNDPELVASAKSFLGEGVYTPAVDPFITMSELQATQRLVQLLGSSGSQVRFVGGRELTNEVAGRNSMILIGHPRGIPWLGKEMAGMNFHFQRVESSGGWTGIFNLHPLPGELPRYRPWGGSEVQKVVETEPDYGLVTRWVHPDGRVVLSITGNRARTGSHLIEKLTDPEFLMSLRPGIQDERWERHRTVQVLFRVNYLSRDRQDTVFLSARFDGQPPQKR